MYADREGEGGEMREYREEEGRRQRGRYAEREVR